MYVCRSRSIAFDLPAFGNKVAPRKDSLICFNNPQTPCEKVIDIPLRISQKKIIVISSWNLVLSVPKRIQLRYSSYSTAIFRANQWNVNYNVLQMAVFRNPSPIILMLHATRCSSMLYFLIDILKDNPVSFGVCWDACHLVCDRGRQCAESLNSY